MKKISQRLLAAAVVAAVGVSASAEVLSPEQALSRALPQGRMAAPALTTPVLAYTAVADELPAVYVFAKENKGFMLVSADDAVTPLLGYSDNGSFDAENMAPEFKYWVDEYSRQIAYIRDNNLEPKTERIARPERAEIEPLCKTKWNQDAPYNLLCPTGTYTGCVATAAAQVMKYFNYPKTALGSDAKFKTTVSGSSTPFEIDCEGWVFQWDKMLDVYSGTVSKESKEAVAQLMVAIGGAVDMNYGDASVGGSGAQTIKVGGAAVKYFGYDKGVQYLSRDCYTLSDWENIIYEQLSTVGPCFTMAAPSTMKATPTLSTVIRATACSTSTGAGAVPAMATSCLTALIPMSRAQAVLLRAPASTTVRISLSTFVPTRAANLSPTSQQ